MYIDINTLFTFEVSKSDDQSILAAIVLAIFIEKYRFWCLLTVINCNKTNIRNENSTDNRKRNVIH
jgi:hypothetical protein